jgi:hypothetical protein
LSEECPLLILKSALFLSCMLFVADEAKFLESLRRDEECYVFEFEVHNLQKVRSGLASQASFFSLGGFVRRTSKECVFCKVVSPLSNSDNLAGFLKGLHQYPKNKLVAKQRCPIKSSDEQDLDMASSRRFLVHSPPGLLKDPKSPDSSDDDDDDDEGDGSDSGDDDNSHQPASFSSMLASFLRALMRSHLHAKKKECVEKKKDSVHDSSGRE